MTAFFRGDRSAEIPLSGALSSEVSLFLHADVVLSCPLFQNCDYGFIYAVVMALQLHIASPGDRIVNKGEPAEEMFFITRGYAAVMRSDSSVVTLVMSLDSRVRISPEVSSSRLPNEKVWVLA